MTIYQRFGYYLGGFAIGLIILTFFLSGKKASCSYGPNARTVKNISSKPIKYSILVEQTINDYQLDTLTVINLIKYGNVDFGNSTTEAVPCNIYMIENSFKEILYRLTVENCDSIATIEEIKRIN